MTSIIERASYWDHPGVSQSQLQELKKTPFHYWSRYVARTVPSETTDALRRGLAVHALTFEPDDFERRFPHFEGEARTNDAKARKAALEAQAAKLDGAVLRDGDVADVHAMVAALRAHPASAALLKAVVASELPIVWDCPTTGIQCKARLDALALGKDVVIDLKTTRDASPREFARSIWNYGYHIQAAHYVAAAEAYTEKRPTDYVIIAVESSAPYAVAVYRLQPTVIAKGESERMRLLDLLAECRAKNHWPAYSDRIEDIELPNWAA